MDTLRSGYRVLGSALSDSEMVYSFLMGMGWFFLLGWAFALIVACASVFKQDRKVRLAGLTEKLANGEVTAPKGP